MKKSLLFFLFLGAINSFAGINSDEKLYYNGTVLTLDKNGAIEESIYIKDGKIVEVGKSNNLLKKFDNKSIQKIDLQGKTISPGFIDIHSHFMNALRISDWANVSAPPVGKAKSIDNILEILKNHKLKQNIKDGEWIIGYGYDENYLDKNLTKFDLDKEFPNNPILILHVSNHGGVLNSLGLNSFNINKDTPTPNGGVISRVPGTNEPEGLLMETAFLEVFAKLPQPSNQELLEKFDIAQQTYAREGYTTIQEGATHANELKLLKEASNNNKLYIDIVSLPLITEVPTLVSEYLVNPNDKKINIENINEQFGGYNKNLKIGGIKLIVDGSPQGKTASFKEELKTPGPNGEKHWKGESLLDQESLNKVYKKLVDNNIKVWTHANGDNGIDMVIEAVKSTGGKKGDGRRDIVIHSQIMHPYQLDEYVNLGLSPSFFTNHVYFWGDVHIKNLGEKLASGISPMNSANKKGLITTNHTDFSITPLNPFMTMWTATNRITKEGKLLGESERVSNLDALKAITVNAAWQLGEEDSKGTLEPGKMGDFVILSENPLEVPKEKLLDLQVIETIKNGKTVYKIK
ncbi:amidohydrolase [Cetobacterium sp. 2A]|uniref:amidohydrolase n=1 Tax=Cetobacterium sp. 2A TaxID=2754723 RepID=UPI00163CE3CB|nr:amidohydrolase [Cetobacterium sp. 2A]MBC2855445.1 amidohydrolase [Cetobacterium sp. 2A]